MAIQNNRRPADHHTLSASPDRKHQLCGLVGDALGALIPARTPLVLLDFPNHSNVGDSAIWCGEADFLDAHYPESPVRWVSEVGWPTEDIPSHLLEGAVVLIHGGGNLGDIWTEHQAYREHIIGTLRSHRVIQLPQSIHFADPTAFQQFADVATQHGDFHLLVRDVQSLEQAREYGIPNVLACPDMAFCMRSHDVAPRSSHAVVAVLRSDRERKDGATSAAYGDEVLFQDWVTDEHNLLERIEAFSARYPLKTRWLKKWLYDQVAAARVRRGYRLLRRGRVVVSDRLHVHILCTLAGIPHVVLDNHYGKIARFREAWGSGEGLCFTATTVDEAIAMALKIDRDGV